MVAGSGFAKGSPERGAGSPNGLTEGFSCSVYGQTPPPHVRSAPPLPGEAWALRASGGFYPPLRFGWGSCCHSANGSVSSGCGRILSAPTVRVGKLLPFGERRCPARFRADSIRPDRGVYKTAALQGAHSPEPIIFLSIRGNAEHIRRTQLRNSAADGLVNLNQLL